MIMMANTSRTQVSGATQPRPAKPTQTVAGFGILSKSSSTAKAAPTHEEIVLRAYEIWLSREKESGRDQEHWFQAERELRGG